MGKNKKLQAYNMRRGHYRCKYNTTIEEYNKLFEQQRGCCAICGRHRSEFKRHFDIDHNHKTRKVRGLVCAGCNRYIGRIEKKGYWYIKSGNYCGKILAYLSF